MRGAAVGTALVVAREGACVRVRGWGVRRVCVRQVCVRVRGWGVRQACVRRVCAAGATGAGVARTEKANFS